MSIPDQIALTAARLLQGRAQGYAGRALRLAQREAARAAERLDTAGPRLTALTEAGLRLTELSCRCVDRLVRQSLASAHGALTDGAERLRMTARARSIGALYADQRAALPASRARVARELQATWKIVASTGRELVEIAQAARNELMQGDSAAGTRAARPRKARSGPGGPSSPSSPNSPGGRGRPSGRRGTRKTQRATRRRTPESPAT